MKFLKSLSVQVLIALVAGLAIGAIAAAWGGDGATPVIEGFEALGGLWLNALRMTVVPLIFAVLVTGIAQVSDAAATGRLAMKAMLWFLGLLSISAVTAVFLVNGLLAAWPVGETASAALRAGAQAPAADMATAPDFAAWVKSLAPSNPIKAASEDAVLPVVVFAIFTGFALTRLPDGRGRALLEVFNGLGEAMIVIVRWVLMAAPLGVFALGLGVGLRAGVGAAGVLGHYVVTASLTGLVIAVLAYLLAVTVGRVPLGRVQLVIVLKPRPQRPLHHDGPRHRAGKAGGITTERGLDLREHVRRAGRGFNPPDLRVHQRRRGLHAVNFLEHRFLFRVQPHHGLELHRRQRLLKGRFLPEAVRVIDALDGRAIRGQIGALREPSPQDENRQTE